jgi:MFS family permease
MTAATEEFMPFNLAIKMAKSKNNNRWNFIMGMVHAVFFSGGTSFVHPDTVIPLFLSTLTSSSIIIGVASMIRGTLGGLGDVIPQLFVAAHLHGVQRRKPFLIKTLIVRAACFFLLGLITLLLYNKNPLLLIVSGLALSFVFTVTGGMASVPFYDIWSRSLPHGMLGTFFAHRHLWGSLFAVLTGLAVTRLLGCDTLGNQEKYAVLFFCAAALMSIGFVGLGSVRESPAKKHDLTGVKNEVFLLAAKVIVADKKLRLYLYAFLLTGAPAMLLPFIVLFARERLSFGVTDIGLFLAIQMAGSFCVTLLWGWMTDRHGCRLTAIISSMVSVAFLCAAILPLLFPHFSRIIMYSVYALIGAWTPGRQVGFDKMLLRMSSEKMRPVYIALKGTFSFPLVIYPLAGAFVLRWSGSYGILLGITSIMTAAGSIAAFVLPNRSELKNADIS